MKPSRSIVAAFPLALALSACSHGGPTVREEDFARVDPSQALAVQTARADVTAAEDEVGAARSRAGEVKREEDAASADRRQADEAVDRAKRALDAAEARKRAADARRDYAEKLRDARQAAEDTGARRLDLANARVELAKLEAVEQTGAPTREKYEKAKFLERVTDCQKRLDEAQVSARKATEDAQAARRKWEQLGREIPAGE